MQLFANFILVFLFIIIIFQDFKHNAITWYIIPLVLIAFCIRGSYFLEMGLFLKYIAINLLFILVQIAALVLYFSVKKGKLINILKEKIGIGDILFFVVLCAGFSSVNFILFFLLALIFTLLVFGIYSVLNKKGRKHIPLAGTFALFYIILGVYGYISELDFYNDNNIEKWLINMN